MADSRLLPVDFNGSLRQPATQFNDFVAVNLSAWIIAMKTAAPRTTPQDSWIFHIRKEKDWIDADRASKFRQEGGSFVSERSSAQLQLTRFNIDVAIIMLLVLF
jgi:hypothetical protein